MKYCSKPEHAILVYKICLDAVLEFLTSLQPLLKTPLRY